MLSFSSLIQPIYNARHVLAQHSTTILTGVGVAGTVTTAVLTGRASMKAARVIDAKKDAAEDQLSFPETKINFSKTEKVKTVWKLYIPPVVSGTATISSIIMAHRISSKKIAALVVAGGITERAFQEYKDKVVEKLGEKKHQAVRDDIAQDRINASPDRSGQVLIVGGGKVLCYDLTTDRYFESTMEDIKKAENKINGELLQHMGASLAEFHELIGLRPTDFTDSVGWGGGDGMFEVQFSSVLTPDDAKPCLAIGFNRPPSPEYMRNFHE